MRVVKPGPGRGEREGGKARRSRSRSRFRIDRREGPETQGQAQATASTPTFCRHQAQENHDAATAMSQSPPTLCSMKLPNASRIQRRTLLLGILTVWSLACTAGDRYLPRNGDIVFHTSRSAQSAAIQLATGSRYSHMGIVYLQEGVPFVFEAVEPVKLTPLPTWIARGRDHHYVAKRLRTADQVLTRPALQRMLEVGRQLEGRHYDLWFEWSDDRLYCSELVWKIYQRAVGLEIGRLTRARDLDLSHPVVQAKLRERYGATATPHDEPVISPAAMFASHLLETVYEQ